MKKITVVIVLIYNILILASCTSSGPTVETIPPDQSTLDQAIREAAENIENRLQPGVKIALLSFNSPSVGFSEYVLEELSGYLVNGGKLVVVDRKDLDLIRQEEQFQLSGEVSDESAQSIGKKLGAQAIVTGSLSDLGKSYRFRIRTLAVETAAILATTSRDINANEERITFLLAGTKPIVEIVSQEEQPPEGLLYEIVDGQSITITQYIGSDTSVNIPASIDGLPVTVIGDKAFYDDDVIFFPNGNIDYTSGHSRLTSITIPSSVTTIGDSAFSGCFMLASINIPSSVTTIGDSAFLGCSSLTTITIPSSVTTIGYGVFSYCTNLANISVEARNSAYTSVNGVLFNKSGQILVCYPAGKNGAYTIPSSVTTIGHGAFCFSNITNITIPITVTIIGNEAFYGCSSLTNVYIPNTVTDIGAMAFEGCTNLISINIPSGLTTIEEGVYSGCTSLTSITIPSSVTIIKLAAFSGCTSLTSVTIPSSVTIIGSGAFWGCSSLISVTLSRRIEVRFGIFDPHVRIQYMD